MDDTLDCDRSIALHNLTMIKVVGRGANLGWAECRHQFRFILTTLKRFCKNNDIKDIRIHNYNDHRWQRWNCTDMAEKGFFPRDDKKKLKGNQLSSNWSIQAKRIVLKCIPCSYSNDDPEAETLFWIKIEFRGEGTEFFGRCHIRRCWLHCHKVSWNNQK